VLDRVARNALAIQLGDQGLADEVYQDVREQVLRPGERRADLRVRIDLAPWRGSGDAETPLFEATVQWEYTATPTSNLRRFACVSDLREYRELMQEPANPSVWHFVPVNGLDADSPTAFELERFTVDGVERPIRRSAREGSQTYTVSLGKQIVGAGRPVKISYAYRTLVRQHGHLLHLQLGQPTKGLHIELRYQGCGIKEVRVLDFITSAQKTTVPSAPASLQDQLVSLSFDGWAFPRSGVAFVWTLDEERSAA
jgi:hypothetical protein